MSETRRPTKDTWCEPHVARARGEFQESGFLSDKYPKLAAALGSDTIALNELQNFVRDMIQAHEAEKRRNAHFGAP